MVSVIAVEAVVLILHLFTTLAEPEFVRYHGEQPKLEIDLQPQSDKGSQVPSVVEAARKYFERLIKNSQEYWPEPVSIGEGETCWWVFFERKERVMLQGGDEVIRTYMPGGVTVSVDKESLSCTVLPSL